ncbi:MAG: translation initiation factor IF-2, partial [Bdellovibrionales bacterium]
MHGSVEAILGLLNKLNTAEVKVRVLMSAVGGISESDVLLAHTAKGMILGFNVRPDTVSMNKAKQIGVEIRTYSIVYEMVDDMKRVMGGLLTPD